MKLLTIFSAPKPFVDPHIITIQRNTIQTWKGLGSDVEIVLVGDEEGIQSTADEFDVLHVAGVKTNSKGTPLVSSIFNLARETVDSKLLAYINADILLLDDFLEISDELYQLLPKFLAVGQRWDLSISDPIDFSQNYRSWLQTRLEQDGRLHPPGGSDYFIFPRTCFGEIPDFAIGRAGWDNWMIYRAREQKWPVVDTTKSINVIHQDHDYSHLPGGQAHYRLQESHDNVELGGGPRTIFRLQDANRKMDRGKLKPIPLTWKKFWREVEIFPLISLKSRLVADLFFATFHPINAYRNLRAWLSS